MINAVYIHIPFCTSICSYCDFCKMYYNEKQVDAYLKSLDEEIKKRYHNDLISTIYIGGGTPSTLKEKQLNKLFDIINIFRLDKNYEFTFECNINDINENLLNILSKNKVNRLSIGIESFNNKYLKFLNRSHNKKQINDNIDLCKKYFNNISVDLIYGLPNQTLEDLNKDIDEFLKLDINHISLYSLIIEPNTILGINNTKNIDEDLEYEMYNLIEKKLKNFNHYEISNYAKKGYESKHNLNYWNNNEYYGFGLGGVAYINSVRYTNTRSLKHYLNGNYVLEEEPISIDEKMSNEMILGLRKINGVNKEKFYQKYGKIIEEVFDIKKLIDDKYLIDDGKNIYINKKYMYVQNSILLTFLGG